MPAHLSGLLDGDISGQSALTSPSSIHQSQPVTFAHQSPYELVNDEQQSSSQWSRQLTAPDSPKTDDDDDDDRSSADDY